MEAHVHTARKRRSAQLVLSEAEAALEVASSKACAWRDAWGVTVLPSGTSKSCRLTLRPTHLSFQARYPDAQGHLSRYADNFYGSYCLQCTRKEERLGRAARERVRREVEQCINAPGRSFYAI